MAFFAKIDTKFFWDGKNKMAMRTTDKLAGNIQGAVLNVLGATRVAKATFASKADIFHVTALITIIKGVTKGWIATMNDFGNIIKDRLSNAIAFIKEGIPVVGENVFDFKRLFAHMYHQRCYSK